MFQYAVHGINHTVSSAPRSIHLEIRIRIKIHQLVLKDNQSDPDPPIPTF